MFTLECLYESGSQKGSMNVGEGVRGLNGMSSTYVVRRKWGRAESKVVVFFFCGWIEECCTRGITAGLVSEGHHLHMGNH